MLERASACLDSGVRLSLRAQRRAPKSRRLLHSNFWHHAAGDIDLPAFFLSSTCPPLLQDAEQPAVPPIEPPFLDFLYPAQTLAYMSRVSASHLDRIWDRRAAHKASTNGLRTYSSMTASTQVRPSPMDKMHVSHSSTESSPPELSNFLASLAAAPDSEATATRAWDSFHTLKERERQNPELIARLLIWLSQLPAAASSQRYILQLFSRLPTEDRSDEVYRAVISAYIATGHMHEAQELHSQARMLLPDRVCGADVMMLHAISNERWDTALEIHESFLPSPPKALWKKLASDPSLDSHILALAKYHMELSDPDQRRRFLGIIEPIWRARIRFAIQSPAFIASGQQGASFRSSLRNLFRNLLSLKLPSRSIYEDLILQLAWTGTSAAIEDVSTLITFAYKRYQESSDFNPSRYMLARLITFWRDQRLAIRGRLSGFKYIDLKTYQRDMERFHERMDDNSLLVVMDCMARLGHMDVVEQYAQKYLALHPEGLKDSGRLWPLVYVHARFARPIEAARQLHRIRADYGVEPDLRCYNIVLHAYEEASDLAGAVETLGDLLRSKIKPDAYTFGPVLNLYAKQGDVDSATNLIQTARTYDLKPTVHMFNSLVVAHVNNDDVESAVKVLEETIELVEKGEADGPITICFNSVLTAHALNRDIESTMLVYRRMKDEGIPLDANTYGALIQVLCFYRQTDAARKIVRTVMRSNNVRPSGFHYAILMAGYVNQGMYSHALDVARDMGSARVRPTGSTRAAQLKAKALHEHSMKGGDLRYAGSDVREPLTDVMKDFEWFCNSERSPPSIDHPGHGLRGQTPVSLLSADFLVFIHGKRRAFDAAKSICETYMSKRAKLEGATELAQPVRLITALMSVHFRNGEYAEVDRYWHLLRSQAEALRKSHADLASPRPRSAAVKSDADAALGPKIPSGSRFILSRPLRYYLASQFSQKESAASSTTELVSSLLSLGYQLDNRTWNAFVVHLCRTSPPRALLAFTLMEKYLIDNWPGWIKARFGVISNKRVVPKDSALREGVEYLRGRTGPTLEDGEEEQNTSPTDSPSRENDDDDDDATAAPRSSTNKSISTRYRAPGTLIPQYKTMVYLASALLELRSLEASGSTAALIRGRQTTLDAAGKEEAFRHVGTLREIREQAPRTWRAARSMPKVYDRLQQRLIRGKE
ncbi:hypothetical protein AAFC00_002234 [Neodothiora populina]|uniref:PROP1-like PPR domain-containing protein n=1 Tax=Neodothiora populina TaxID=2781224 RepID=A0ABR3PGR3_9PEZI